MGPRICLAVSKGWKAVLEGSKELWTTLDTTFAKKAISMKSLKIHLRRSKYTLDCAILTTKAYIDMDKMRYITKTCKGLRELHIGGSGIIGDTLMSALPGATKLESISVAQSTEISLSHAQAVIGACHASLVDIKLLNVRGSSLSFIPGRWPNAASIKSIHLKGDGYAFLDIVSCPQPRYIFSNAT